MYQKRCPWCGKTIQENGFENLKLFSKKTPKPLHFGKCLHCNNYIAQMYSLRELILLIVAAILCILICIANHYLIALGLLVLGTLCIYTFKTTPFRRANEQEEYVVPEAKVYSATVLLGFEALKDEAIYLTAPDFDEKPLYSTSSPIRIVKLSKKDKYVEFYFLYNNEDNVKALCQDTFTFYNENGQECKLSIQDNILAGSA